MRQQGKKETLVLSVADAGEEKAVELAARIIRKGGAVAFPTETVYGLGADATNPRAVEMIFKAKNRPPDNPLIVHVTGMKQVEKLTREIPPAAYKLAERFWPGPLTLVLLKKDVVPAITTAGLSSVAVRVPAHSLALKLIEKAGVPLAAPSANLSGRPSPTMARHVLEDLAGRIDAILDGGPCPVGVESTVISLLSHPPILLRPGGVTLEDLEKALGGKILDFSGNPVEDKERPLSPGMKYRHYATRAPLYLVLGEGEALRKRILSLSEGFAMQGRKVGLLVSEEFRDVFSPAVLEILGSKKEPALAAKRLFDAMRRLDERGVDVIIAEGWEEREMGRALMNRLRKAATEIIY